MIFEGISGDRVAQTHMLKVGATRAGYAGPSAVRFWTSSRWEETPQLPQLTLPRGNLFQVWLWQPFPTWQMLQLF